VRLRYGYYVTCREVVKDDAGEVVELICRYDPETRGGTSPDGRKVKGTIHWVSARHAVDARVRLYDRLFVSPNPGASNFLEQLNPDSLQVLEHCKLEPDLAGARAEYRCQLERQGYFCVDPASVPGRPVLNRTVTLRDSWVKQSG
jgi:glutaminyl-tRNA synthetase